LKKIHTYKSLIAAVLLTVYAFIATPVQLWHHHHSVANAPAKESFGEEKQASQATISQQQAEIDCQLCAHYDSVFSDVALLAFETPCFIFNPQKAFYSFLVPSFPYFNFFNKGPPAVA